jgi:hypothetical protein
VIEWHIGFERLELVFPELVMAAVSKVTKEFSKVNDCMFVCKEKTRWHKSARSCKTRNGSSKVTKRMMYVL